MANQEEEKVLLVHLLAFSKNLIRRELVSGQGPNPNGSIPHQTDSLNSNSPNGH